jgi:hypothetical protein
MTHLSNEQLSEWAVKGKEEIQTHLRTCKNCRIRALGALSLRQYLYLLEEHSIAEIAEAMGVEVETVKLHLLCAGNLELQQRNRP